MGATGTMKELRMIVAQAPTEGRGFGVVEPRPPHQCATHVHRRAVGHGRWRTMNGCWVQELAVVMESAA